MTYVIEKCAGLPFQSLQASLEAAQSYAGTASLAEEKETPEKEDHQTITAIPQSLSNAPRVLRGILKDVNRIDGGGEAGGGFRGW